MNSTTLPTEATDTAGNIAAAIVPALESYPWWAAVAGILAWVIVLAPVVDRIVDATDTKLDNRIWRWAKVIIGGLTRRKK